LGAGIKKRRDAESAQGRGVEDGDIERVLRKQHLFWNKFWMLKLHLFLNEGNKCIFSTWGKISYDSKNRTCLFETKGFLPIESLTTILLLYLFQNTSDICLFYMRFSFHLIFKKSCKFYLFCHIFLSLYIDNLIMNHISILIELVF